MIENELSDFDGMLFVHLINQENTVTITFFITYQDGSTVVKQVDNETNLYKKYIKILQIRKIY